MKAALPFSRFECPHVGFDKAESVRLPGCKPRPCNEGETRGYLIPRHLANGVICQVRVHSDSSASARSANGLPLSRGHRTRESSTYRNREAVAVGSSGGVSRHARRYSKPSARQLSLYLPSRSEKLRTDVGECFWPF